jgi:polar amino acid transport system permease protein
MRFDFSLFVELVFSEAFATGALIAITLAIVSQLGAVLLGFFLALGLQSKIPALKGISFAYIWFFRAIPSLLVLVVLWNATPQMFPIFRENWYSPFIAAFIGLALTEAAYMAEVIRSAMSSVDDGQLLAARALGMSPRKSLLRVILPQAIRVAIPPTANEFIGMIKGTSLASVLSLKELTTTAQLGVSTTFRYAENYSAASLYYLVIVSILMVAQMRIEKRFAWISPVDTRKRGFAGILPRPRTSKEKVEA